MAKKKVLFISWQGGMGHITRDLAIADALHKHNPEIELCWLAHPLATRLLEEAGERLLPESDLSVDYNLAGLKALTGFQLNLMKYIIHSWKPCADNVKLFEQVVRNYTFDLIVGDEIYEIAKALALKKIQIENQIVMIHDFVGTEAMSSNPLERFLMYYLNRLTAKKYPMIPRSVLRHFFVGEPEDVPDRPFGFLLPNRREWANEHFTFLGHVVRFDPAEYADKGKIRAKLGYGNEPLIVCATGGTGAGKELLELCAQAYQLIKELIPNLRMVLVCGNLFGTEPPQVPAEFDLEVYIPKLYEHYAACDLAIVVGGGTTTIELTALQRPFLFFPLESQFDQQVYIPNRLARHGAGIRMEFSQTTPESLAKEVVSNVGKEVSYPVIPINGAQKAAELINELL